MTFLEERISGAGLVGHTWNFVEARRELRYAAGCGGCCKFDGGVKFKSDGNCWRSRGAGPPLQMQRRNTSSLLRLPGIGLVVPVGGASLVGGRGWSFGASWLGLLRRARGIFLR